MNTPRVAIQETKKAFRNAFKRQDLQAAMAALCNLKGVGPTVASGKKGETRKELKEERRKKNKARKFVQARRKKRERDLGERTAHTKFPG